MQQMAEIWHSKTPRPPSETIHAPPPPGPHNAMSILEVSQRMLRCVEKFGV